MIVVILVAALLLVMGIVILLGKGDNLIAGYNTTEDIEKSRRSLQQMGFSAFDVFQYIVR